MLNKKKNILVIDDEKNIREDLKLTLELNGYNVDIAFDGKDGVEKIKSTTPDMIICDIMMPRLDGYGVLKFCRESDVFINIPFLFLSAKGDYSELREGMNLGADDYIPKPFDFKHLLDAIKTRLEKSDKKVEQLQKGLDSVLENLNKSIPHELRTPLNGILNYAEYLYNKRDSLDEDSINEMLKSMIDDGKRLQSLIENYIYFANLELLFARKDQLKYLNNHTYKPNSIIRNYIKILPNNDKSRIKLKVINDIEFINIDEMHFTKILREILANAIKFSDPTSEITVHSSFIKCEYRFQVENHGRGFPPELLNLIGAFSQFERDKFEQQGIGLGLAIVDKLIKIYDGKVIINSEKDKTTFVGFSLPILNK